MLPLSERVALCLLSHGSLTASEIALRLGEPTAEVRRILASDRRFTQDAEDGRHEQHAWKAAA